MTEVGEVGQVPEPMATEAAAEGAELVLHIKTLGSEAASVSVTLPSTATVAQLKQAIKVGVAVGSACSRPASYLCVPLFCPHCRSDPDPYAPSQPWPNTAIDVHSALFSTFLQEKTAVEEGLQRLIYRGKVLVDAQTLASYDVETGHSIHCVPRPR
jgi:hypothetical protein